MKNEQEKKKGPIAEKNTFLKVMALCTVIFSILMGITYYKERDIEKNGVKNKAMVTAVNFVNYTDNEKSHQPIAYYQVQVAYLANGKSFSKILEFQPRDFENKFGGQLTSGDSVSIIHVADDPVNVMIP